jgi:hypothetical protein
MQFILTAKSASKNGGAEYANDTFPNAILHVTLSL